ncbi:MAG: MBL fold metallo-hydrolase [Acidimicrobiales bacterium]
MKITLLGTGSPLPNPDRAGPATLVRSTEAIILFDAGRGVVMRLAKANVLPTMLAGVVLTHLHSDHVSDLNDVITTHWVMSPEPTPLRVLGPVGTRTFVAATLDALAIDIGYRLAHHADLNEGPLVEVTELAPSTTFELGGLAVLAGATDHRPVEPSLGYRVTDADQSVVIAGDGVPCASLDALVKGASAYVQTVIREDLVRLIPSARLQDILDYHSSVEQAAATAQRAGVKALVLTHMVPPPLPGTEHEWRELASAFHGLIVLGDDMVTLDLDTMDVTS